jgi:hypothetical protein
MTANGWKRRFATELTSLSRVEPEQVKTRSPRVLLRWPRPVLATPGDESRACAIAAGLPVSRDVAEMRPAFGGEIERPAEVVEHRHTMLVAR